MRTSALQAILGTAALLSFPAIAGAASNPICPDNTAFFNPTLPPSINLPQGFTASVFAAGERRGAATHTAIWSPPSNACKTLVKCLQGPTLY